MTKTKELRCCLGCGRDTYGEYCHRCMGSARPQRVEQPRGELPLEDDYSEESDADSVCQDNSASVSPAF